MRSPPSLPSATRIRLHSRPCAHGLHEPQGTYQHGIRADFGPYAAHLVPAQLGHRVPASTANFQLFFKDFGQATSGSGNHCPEHLCHLRRSSCQGLHSERRGAVSGRHGPQVFNACGLFVVYMVLIKWNSASFCSSVKVLHFANSARCSSVISAGPFPSEKNCAKVIPNALHTASKVGSVGALFLLNIFVTVE